MEVRASRVAFSTELSSSLAEGGFVVVVVAERSCSCSCWCCCCCCSGAGVIVFVMIVSLMKLCVKKQLSTVYGL